MRGNFGIFYNIEIFKNKLIKKTLKRDSKTTFVFNEKTSKIEKLETELST